MEWIFYFYFINNTFKLPYIGKVELILIEKYEEVISLIFNFVLLSIRRHMVMLTDNLKHDKNVKNGLVWKSMRNIITILDSISAIFSSRFEFLSHCRLQFTLGFWMNYLSVN